MNPWRVFPSVVPAKAGIQPSLGRYGLGSLLRGNDRNKTLFAYEIQGQFYKQLAISSTSFRADEDTFLKRFDEPLYHPLRHVRFEPKTQCGLPEYADGSSGPHTHRA